MSSNQSTTSGALQQHGQSGIVMTTFSSVQRVNSAQTSAMPTQQSQPQQHKPIPTSPSLQSTASSSAQTTTTPTQQSQPQHNQPIPTPPSSYSTATPNVPPTLAPNQHRQSIFHFRSERTNWIAVAAIVITILFGIPALMYAVASEQLAEDSKRLAIWEAEKDFQIYCQGVQAQGKSLSTECANVVDAVLTPPPFYDTSIFVRATVKIKRFIAQSITAEHGPQTQAIASFWLIVIASVVGVRGVRLYDNAVSEAGWIGTNMRLTEAGRLGGAFAVPIVPTVWRLSLCADNAPYGHPNLAKDKTCSPILRFASHFWLLAIFLHLYVKRSAWHWLHAWLSASSYYRAIDDLLVGDQQSWVDILASLLVSLATTYHFKWVLMDMDRVSSRGSLGPAWRLHARRWGSLLSVPFGVSLLLSDMLGGPVAYYTGDPIVNQHVLTPFLEIYRKLNTWWMLIYLTAGTIEKVIRLWRSYRPDAGPRSRMLLPD